MVYSKFVNATTCEYGLAGPDCRRTFASFDPQVYHAVQIGYELVGVTLLFVSSYKYRLARKHLGSKVQHRVFLMAMFCALTFVLRAVDPLGYDHVIPHWLSNALADSCTAMLYSAYMLSCVFWISLIRQLKSINDLPLWIRLTALAVNVATWVLLLFDSFRFMTAYKGYTRPKFVFKLFYLSIVLCLITGISLYYGYRIYQRLMALHEQMSNSAACAMELSTATSLSPSSGYQSDPNQSDLEAPKPKVNAQIQQLERTAQLASRMYRILLAMVLFSAVNVILQTYFGFVDNRKNAQWRKAIRCSNGRGCEDLHINQQWLCGMQAIGIALIVWAYGKIRKLDESS